MRITSGMMVNNMIRNINLNLENLAKLQEQSSTGLLIQYASENPVIATRTAKIQTYLAEVEQLQKNADDAASWMEFSESALRQIYDNVHDIRELVVEGSNETYSEDDLASIKTEIEQILNGILDTANSSYSGRYVFAGYSTDEAPFELVTTDVGEKVMYNGKYLSLGGPVSSSVSDTDYEAFYLDNMGLISGQAELISAKFSSFTASSPNLDFEITLDGVTQTISLTDGVTYDLATLQTELQAKIDAAFPSTGSADSMIKVSTEDGKLVLTVQDGNSIQINSGSLDVRTLGFSDAQESERGESEDIEYRLGSGCRVTVNVEGSEVFGEGNESLFNTLTLIKMALDGETSYKTAEYVGGSVVIESHELDLSSLLDSLDEDMSRIMTSISVIGARSSFVELTQNRLEDNYATFTELLSNTADVDYAEVSIKLTSAKTIYEAALSTGASTIQLSLIDFLS